MRNATHTAALLFAALLGAGDALGVDERGAPVEAPKPAVEGLSRLLDAHPSKVPNARDLAVEFLESGPAEVGAFLVAFERTALERSDVGADLAGLALVSQRIRETPAIVDATLSRKGIPGAMRNGAVSVALEVLARDPGPESTLRAARLLARTDANEPGTIRDLALRLRRFTTATLDLRPDRPGDLTTLVRAAGPALASNVLDGIAESRHGTLAASHLVRLMESFEGLDGTALNRIERIARRSPVRLPASDCDAVRLRLEHPSPFIRREAAFASGSIGDHDAILALIGLLDDPSQSVSTAAHTSLRTLTSMTIAADPNRWRVWYEQQEAWWRARGQAAVARLAHAPPGELVDLVAEVSTKRLYRDEVASALLDVLETGEVRTIELALSALANLRSPASVPVIRGLALSSSPVVRRRAQEALRALKAGGVEVDTVLVSH